MMALASLSAAASAAIRSSSTVCVVAVTIRCLPPCPETPPVDQVKRQSSSMYPSVVPVQPAFGYVLHDPVRDQVPDRLARADPLTARGGRDRERRDLDQARLPLR